MDKIIKNLLDHIKNNSEKIEFNNHMMEITEGNLLEHIRRALSKQLSSGSNVEAAMQRCAPINVWNKIIKKLSKVYSAPPKRTTENPADLELIQYYEDLGINNALADANLNYNNYKWTTIELYEDTKDQCLKMRSIPSTLFLPYGGDKIDPLRVTGMIKFMGMEADTKGDVRSKYWYYSDEDFLSFYDNGDLALKDMEENEGDNPFNILNFSYLSKSKVSLIPIPDRDTYQMTVNIPVLITDQNFASLYLSIPIIYSTNIDAEKLPQSPNAFWNLHPVDPNQPTSIGVLKPEPDLANQMNNVKEQLSMWLESRDIKPGAAGTMTSENFSSSLSKIISEMDTVENIKEQKEYFKAFERDVWKRIAIMHNELVKMGRSKERRIFSDPENLIVVVEFQESAVLESRVEKVNRLKVEVDSGFKSKRQAIKDLNPDLGEDEIDNLILEIEKDRTIYLEDSDVQDKSSRDPSGQGDGQSDNNTALVTSDEPKDLG